MNELSWLSELRVDFYDIINGAVASFQNSLQIEEVFRSVLFYTSLVSAPDAHEKIIGLFADVFASCLPSISVFLGKVLCIFHHLVLVG